MFYLLLTLALDMSRPEFQPTPDISGNYIVSSVSENDSSVELMSELPPITYTAVNEADNTAIVDAINESISHNDSYWELFLDSYPVYENHSNISNSGFQWPWRFDSSGSIVNGASSSGRYAYIPVQAGVEYTISDIFAPNYNQYYCGIVDDINNPTTVSDFFIVSSPFNSFTITPSVNGFLVFYINYWRDVSFNVSWTTVERESYTLSELGNAVTQSYDKLVTIVVVLSGCELILLFSAVVPFLTKVIDKLMNKKED